MAYHILDHLAAGVVKDPPQIITLANFLVAVPAPQASIGTGDQPLRREATGPSSRYLIDEGKSSKNVSAENKDGGVCSLHETSEDLGGKTPIGTAFYLHAERQLDNQEQDDTG